MESFGGRLGRGKEAGSRLATATAVGTVAVAVTPAAAGGERLLLRVVHGRRIVRVELARRDGHVQPGPTLRRGVYGSVYHESLG